MLGDIVQNFPKYEKKILEICNRGFESYFNSECFRVLKRRTDILTDSYNLKYTGRSASRTKVAFPLVLEKANMRRAVLKSALRGDPLINIDPLEDTPRDNAIVAEKVLNNNFRIVRYRDRFLNGGNGLNFLAKYGTLVGYNRIVHTTNVERGLGMGDFGAQEVARRVNRRNVQPVFIHYLNYFQDPTCSVSADSWIKGHIERWRQADLIDAAKNSNMYIKQNIESLISKLHGKSSKNIRFWQGNRDPQPDGEVDLVCCWVTLSDLEGNEDDTAEYYVEMAENHIVRFQDDPFFFGNIKYPIFTLDKRIEYWWGNTDAEWVLSHENSYNLLMNMQIDNVTNEMMRYIFYKRGTIDTADINNRWMTNGFVPVDGEESSPISNLLQQWNPSNTSNSSLQQALNEINASQQRMSTKYDYQAQNGINMPNKTAYAASVVEGQGDTQEADVIEQMSIGLTDTAQDMMVKLQQVLPDRFMVRPDPRKNPEEYGREDICGAFSYYFTSSAQRSKSFKAQQIMAGISNLIRLAASNVPGLQRMNIVPAVKEYVRQSDLGDIAEILPEQQAPESQGMAPMISGGQPPLPAQASRPENASLSPLLQQFEQRKEILANA